MADHSISEILNWYHRFSGANPPHNRDTQVDFQDVMVLANELELLQDCFPKPGSISVVLPSNEQPELSILHRSITVSYFSTYSLRYLFRRSVRRFYCNFTLNEVNGISERMTAKVTLMELLTVLNRMLLSQEEQSEYPNIHEDDLPYRSRSWVLSLIEYLERDFIGRRIIGNEDFDSINELIGHILFVVDYYETALADNEARYLREFVLHPDE